MNKEELYNKLSELFIELAKEEHRHREEIEFLHCEVSRLYVENDKLKNKNERIAAILLEE